jgi:hypothetical protein
VDVAGAVGAVSLKLPVSFCGEPEVWFTRVEAQFSNRNITVDLTKFNYVVAALNDETASEVKAVLIDPPEEDKYLALRKALLEAYGTTQARKGAELLGLAGLGDRKPTALLRNMRSLNSDADTLFRALFLQQLPSDVRGVVASLNLTTLDELAVAADHYMEANPTSGSSSVFAASMSNRSNLHDRRSRRTTFDRNVNPAGNFVCHYHATYGPRARSCRPGCAFADLPLAPHPSSQTSRTSTSSGNDRAGR